MAQFKWLISSESSAQVEEWAKNASNKGKGGSKSSSSGGGGKAKKLDDKSMAAAQDMFA